MAKKLRKVDWFVAKHELSNLVANYMNCIVWKEEIRLNYEEEIKKIKKTLEKLKHLEENHILDNLPEYREKYIAMAELERLKKERNEEIKKHSTFKLSDADKTFNKNIRLAETREEIGLAAIEWFKNYGLDIRNSYFLEEFLSSFRKKYSSNSGKFILDKSGALANLYSISYNHMVRVGTIKPIQIPEVIREKYTPKSKQQITLNIKKSEKEVPQIGVKDFVVRRSVFKCSHSEHKLEDIVAAINILDKQNEVKLIKVNAGYCPNCKLFFILENTYQNLKNKGIPICRVSDEKTYLKNSFNFLNEMALAQQSVLMQYGYNVNQIEGLSATRRQKILVVLIDKEILTKSEIISYLEFFINMRQYNSKFETAIAKWEMDIEFVEDYRLGEYHQYGVNGIYRR